MRLRALLACSKTSLSRAEGVAIGLLRNENENTNEEKAHERKPSKKMHKDK